LATLMVSCFHTATPASLHHPPENEILNFCNANTYASATGKVARLHLSLSRLPSQTSLRTVQHCHTSLAGTARDMRILLSTLPMSEELYVNSATSRSVGFTMPGTQYHSINQRRHSQSSLVSSMALTLARVRRSIWPTSHQPDP
jgi:hypothetical protein